MLAAAVLVKDFATVLVIVDVLDVAVAQINKQQQPVRVVKEVQWAAMVLRKVHQVEHALDALVALATAENQHQAVLVVDVLDVLDVLLSV